MKLTEDMFLHIYPKDDGLIYADPDKKNIALQMPFSENLGEVTAVQIQYTSDFFLGESYIPLNHILFSSFALS